MAMKESTKTVFSYLQSLGSDANVTAADVAAALDIDKRKVDGVFTSAIQRKGYGIRVPAEVELPDGTHRAIKFLKLTQAGFDLDLDAADEE